MLLPLFASVLHSIKSPDEGAAVPPTYFPHSFSFESYAKLWDYQAGLADLSLQQRRHGVPDDRADARADRPGRLRAGALPDPGKEMLFVFLLLCADHPVPGAADADLPDVRAAEADQLDPRARDHPHRDPAAVQPLHHAQRFEAVPRELEEAAVIDGCNSWQVLMRICLPAVVPAIVTVSLFAFITSWNEFLGALVMMNKGDTFTLPLILAAARSVSSLGGTDWGMLQAGVTISIMPCIAIYLLLQRYYVSGFLSGVVK